MLASTPSSERRSSTASHVRPRIAHTIRTGRRSVPADAWANGSGQEPTTAGARIASVQSR